MTELQDLNSSLANLENPHVFTIPNGYFDALPLQVIEKIRAREELAELSPLLSGISKNINYAVPAGYFESLTIPGNSNEQLSVEEELSSISPLLISARGKTPYSVPENYFASLSVPELADARVADARVVPISRRGWFRYAAAAVITAVIVSLGFLLLSRNEIDPDVKPFAWVEKKLKKVSTDEINEFVLLVDQNSTDVAVGTTPSEINELIKEVSVEDIHDFLEETEAAEPDLKEDFLN